MYSNFLILVLILPPGLSYSRAETIVFFMPLSQEVSEIFVLSEFGKTTSSSDLHTGKAVILVLSCHAEKHWQQGEATRSSSGGE